MSESAKILCHLDQTQDIRCFTEEGKGYPVLRLGPVTIFPSDEQLAAIGDAIEYYLAHRAAEVAPERCDLCGDEFSPLECGQTTADTCICGDCIRRLGGPSAKELKLPF